MNTMILIVILNLVCGPVATAINPSNDVRLEKNKPTVYIEFERAGNRKPLYANETNQGIWLRLHNNTKWSLSLDFHGVPSADYGDAAPIYDVLSGNQIIIPDSCHACSFGSLGSGRSLLFSVAAEHLSMGRALRIRFNYSWEESNGIASGSEPEHYVYFYSATLPKKLQQQSP